MGHDSVSEMLRNIGDNDTADAINVHEQCHQEIAELCGKISHLEAELKKIRKAICVYAREEFEDIWFENDQEVFNYLFEYAREND